MKRLPPFWVAMALVLTGVAGRIGLASGQELEPRLYVNTPVGLDFLVAGYACSDGNVASPPSAQVTDARLETHAGFLACVRSADVGGRSGQLRLLVPCAAASGSARVGGMELERDVSGLSDPRLRFSVNLFGAPAGSRTSSSGSRWKSPRPSGSTIPTGP